MFFVIVSKVSVRKFICTNIIYILGAKITYQYIYLSTFSFSIQIITQSIKKRGDASLPHDVDISSKLN